MGKSAVPRARFSTKSTIRIFSSTSSTTTSQQKIASSNSSRKSSGNEKRERENRAESKPFQNSNVHLFIFVHKLSHSRCFNFISEFAPFIFPETRRIFITFFCFSEIIYCSLE